MGIDWSNPVWWLAVAAVLIALPFAARFLVGVALLLFAGLCVVVAGLCGAGSAIRRAWRK